MNRQSDPVLAELGEILATHYTHLVDQNADRPEVAFGRYLRAARKTLNITLAEAAQHSAISESELLAYERGLIPKRYIQTAALHALATLYHDDVNRFLTLLNSNLVTSAPPSTENRWWGWLTDQAARYVPDMLLVRPNHFWKPVALFLALLCISLGYRGSTSAGLLEPPAAPTLQAELVAQPNSVDTAPAPVTVWNGGEPLITTVDIAGQRVASHSMHIISPILYSGLASSNITSTITVAIADVQIMSKTVHWSNDGVVYHYRGITSPQGDSMEQQYVVHKREPTASEATGLVTTETPARKPPPPQPWGELTKLFLANIAAPAITMIASTPLTSRGTPTEIVETSESRSVQESANTITPNTGDSGQQLVLHVLDHDENPWCLAEKYYSVDHSVAERNKAGSLYPLLCLYNFGVNECKPLFREGMTILIPTQEDLIPIDSPLGIYLAENETVGELFTTVSKAQAINNRANRRGLEYFCVDGDYERYGKPALTQQQVAQAGPASTVP